MKQIPDKKIRIEAELPIPLGELATYISPKKEGVASIAELLEKKPHIPNSILLKFVSKIIKRKKFSVNIEKIEFDYCDSERIERGVAYFNAILTGTEKELRKVAGEDRIFFFDWEEGIKMNVQEQI